MPFKVEVKDFESEYKEKGSYHHNAQGFKKWFLKVNYELLAKGVKSEDRLLDLGCGEGEFSKYAPTDNIIGIDNSQTAINLAKKIAKKGEYKVMDMLNLDFENNLFDSSICSLTLFYFGKDSINKVLQEVKRVLKPHGRFIFSYKNLEHPKVKEFIGKLDNTKESFSLEELKEILEENGFTIKDIVGTNLMLDFAGIKEDRLDELYELSRKLGYYLPRESYHFVIYTEVNK